MDEVKVNFVEKKIPPKPRRGFFYFGRVFAALLAVFALSLAVISFRLSAAATADEHLFDTLPVFSQIRSFVRSKERVIENHRKNILLLGVGGPGHEGPQLSDTMLFVSLDTKDKRVGVISIPRDLAVEIPGHGEQKINAANAYGEEKGRGEGPKLAAQVVETVFGEPIDYYLRIDFQAFVDIIDTLGGIDVTVDRSFSDSQFPTEDYQVQTISFAAGRQHMDGLTALRFARSRHGNNGEGSDFARSARQQKIINAIKDKALSRSTFLSPTKISGILDTLKAHVATNLSALDLINLGREYGNIGSDKIATHVLMTGNGPLYETRSNDAYVILPKAGNWSELQALADNIFTPDANAAPVLQTAHIEVQNGTTINGLARTVAGNLVKNGFEVEKISNAAERGVVRTIVYDLTKGTKPNELKRLTTLLDADVKKLPTDWVFVTDIPSDDSETAESAPLDFIVIVGESAGQQ